MSRPPQMIGPRRPAPPVRSRLAPSLTVALAVLITALFVRLI